jgi:shikimate dehydrogenase
MSESKLFGIVAHPVHHSLSPIMHNAAFAKLELLHHYHAFDVRSMHLKAAIEAMKTLRVSGLNVSIPHKVEVMQYLDEIDTEAQAIGAVNTILLQEDGRLKGYNTDGAGYVQSLLAETQIELAQSKTLLLGAGGAAKGIAVYLIKQGCTEITIANRTRNKAEQLVIQLEEYMSDQGIVGRVACIEWEKASHNSDAFNLIVNTTPIGMWPNIEQTPIYFDHLGTNTIVSDIVYNPLNTLFLTKAEQKGANIHQGLGMFIYQGALAFEYFTGEKAPIECMREVVLKRLKQGG